MTDSVIPGTCGACGNASHECECAPENEQIGPRIDRFLKGVRNSGDFRRCFDCLDRDCPYMVEGLVWKQAWPEYHNELNMLVNRARAKNWPSNVVFGLLCLRCLSMRLGRPLRIEDFPNVPINLPIRVGYQMGLDASRKTES